MHIGIIPVVYTFHYTLAIELNHSQDKLSLKLKKIKFNSQTQHSFQVKGESEEKCQCHTIMQHLVRFSATDTLTIL